MKFYLISITLLLSTQALFAQNDSTGTHKAESLICTCSMHPDIITNEPGKCPRCGMDLVKKNSSPDDKMGMMMCQMHGMVAMNHEHEGQKKDNMKIMKGMGIVMGVMMVVMMFILGTN